MKTQALSSYSDLELALMVLLGYYGNGAARKNALGSRYAAAQSIVEQILKGTVPRGSGEPATQEKIKAAVKSVFNDMIDELSKEIANDC